MENTQRSPSRFLSVLVSLFIVLVICCATVVACIFYRDHLIAMEEQEASKMAHYLEHNQSVSDFPHAMKISGKTAYLSSVDAFETKVDHGYVAHVIITIDRGELTDDDIYWILKDKRYDWELDADVLWWPEGIEGESDSLHFLDCVYNDSTIYFFFYSDAQRYSLKDTSISVHIHYQQDGADRSEEYRYLYSLDFSGDEYHDSSSFLPVETQLILLDALEEENG